MDRRQLAEQIADKHIRAQFSPEKMAQHSIANQQSLHQRSNNAGVRNTREVYRPTGVQGHNAIDTNMVKQARPFTQGGQKFGWSDSGGGGLHRSPWHSETGLELDNVGRANFFPAVPNPRE